MSALLFIIILAVLVFVHELGHFIAAKRSGVRVDEFSIGFPPRLFSWKKGETLYSLNLIPFGGYVKIFGEDPNDESLNGPDATRSLVRKPKYIQAIVLVAGIVFNLLFAWLLISISLASGYKMPVDGAQYPVTNARVTVLSVMADSPAFKAQLKEGDKIISLGEVGQAQVTPNEVADVQSVISNSKDVIAITYERSNTMHSATITPALGIVGAETKAIGIQMAKVGEVHLPFYRAIWEGGKMTIDVSKQTVVGLVQFFGKAFQGKASVDEISGPIGIAGMVGDASHFGFMYLLGFTAYISINLAIINLMPFPALDGGRLFFLGLEAVIRRKISPVFLNVVNAVGFIILIGLMLFVTYHDIIKLW